MRTKHRKHSIGHRSANAVINQKLNEIFLKAQQEFRDKEKDSAKDQKQEETANEQEGSTVEGAVGSSTNPGKEPAAEEMVCTLSSESDVEIVLEENVGGTKCRAQCH